MKIIIPFWLGNRIFNQSSSLLSGMGTLTFTMHILIHRHFQCICHSSYTSLLVHPTYFLFPTPLNFSFDFSCCHGMFQFISSHPMAKKGHLAFIRVGQANNPSIRSNAGVKQISMRAVANHLKNPLQIIMKTMSNHIETKLYNDKKKIKEYSLLLYYLVPPLLLSQIQTD